MANIMQALQTIMAAMQGRRGRPRPEDDPMYDELIQGLEPDPDSGDDPVFGGRGIYPEIGPPMPPMTTQPGGYGGFEHDVRSDMDFMNMPNRPEIGRPTMKADPNFPTPESFERDNPDWRDKALAEEIGQMNASDRARMMGTYHQNPEKYKVWRGRGYFQGQPNSPDLPSEEDVLELEANPTDGTIMDFMEQFGLARTQDPRMLSPEIPLPRPRMPDMREDIFGPVNRLNTKPKSQEEQIAGTPPGNLRASDFNRRMEDVFTTEDELDMVQRHMAEGEQDQIMKRGHRRSRNPEQDELWEGWEDGEPTEADIQTLRNDPQLLDEFIDVFGEDMVPDDLYDRDADR